MTAAPATGTARARTILVLCDEVGTTGGTESYLSRVLPALVARGLDVRVAARRIAVPGAYGLPAREIGWATDHEPANAAAARAVRDLIAELAPAAVMTSNVHDAGVLAAARAAPRLVVRIHDHRAFCPQGDRRFPHLPGPCALPMGATTCLPNALARGCIAGLSTRSLALLRSRERVRDVVRLADRVVVSSGYMARLCQTNGIAAQRVAVIPPPFGGPTGEVPRPPRDRVLFAGRLVRDKGLASLIDAIGYLPREARPELAVAGAMTREAESLPARAAARGVAMTLLGKGDRSELIAQIDASTLVAVPSLWPEPFGLMGVEAFARARPVAAYDAGSISEWIGAAGVLAPTGDARALARAIRTVLDPARWPAFSAAAARQATGYGADRHAAALAEVLLATERERLDA